MPDEGFFMLGAKNRAPRNRALTISPQELEVFRSRCVRLTELTPLALIENKILQQNLFESLNFLPRNTLDLLFLDPPYNLTKSFNNMTFRGQSLEEYENWFEAWFEPLMRVLKPSASVYICGDWRSASAIQRVASKYLVMRNRITWEREKGRGAEANWKNNAEDIWYGVFWERNSSGEQRDGQSDDTAERVPLFEF